MIIIDNYAIAVSMCFITMLCWGSWANTQKLASKNWKYQLFYWDYGFGVLAIALLLALTMGSFGSSGRSFLADIQQSSGHSIGWAILGGVIFNLSNILLVGAIDITGLAVAFPLAIGIALVIATVTNYIANPLGNTYFLFLGVACVIIALIADVLAYKKIPSTGQKTPIKGFILSVLSGITMGFFYRFVAASMSIDFVNMEVGKLNPYSAVVIFSVGLVLSNFLFNSILMVKPFTGEPLAFSDYFKKGTPKLHLIGMLGGSIWGLGMVFSILSAGSTGYAISYGLGAQGGTLVAALWGVFIWKEFKNAHKGVISLLTIMFLFYIIGLIFLILAR